MKRLCTLFTVLLLALTPSVRADINAYYPGYGVAQAQATGTLFIVGVPTRDFEYYASPQTAGHQRSQNWCWAACVQMVLNSYGISTTQELLVQRIFGAQIDTPAGPPQIIAAVSGQAINSQGRVSVVSATANVPNYLDIIGDLSFHRPLIVILRNPGMEVGHVFVLTALEYSAGRNGLPFIDKVVLRDPWPGNPSRVEMPQQEFFSRLEATVRVAVRNY